jgi:hypothetical protein
MKFLFATLLIASVVGCVPLAPRIYMPSDFPTSSRWGRMCEPEYTATLFQNDELTLRIVTDSISSGLFRGRLQLNAPKAHSARFLANQLSINGPTFTTPMIVPLGGPNCGSPDSLAPRTDVECFFAATPSGQQAIQVIVPSFQVDNIVYDPKSVRYQLQRVPMIVGACQ